MDERRHRVTGVLEWIAAAAGVLLLIGFISVPVQRLLGPGVEAAISDNGHEPSPPGVPAGAANVPVMLLTDGREIRVGDLQSRVASVLPERFADGPAQMSAGATGERHTRAYVVQGVRFYIVSERLEPRAPLRVSGIYLP